MPYLPEGIAEGEVQVSVVRSHATIAELLAEDTTGITRHMDGSGQEQMKDPKLKDFLLHLTNGVLPSDKRAAQEVIAQAPRFKGILYGRQRDRLRIVVPGHLRKMLLLESHAWKMAGHFSGLSVKVPTRVPCARPEITAGSEVASGGGSATLRCSGSSVVRPWSQPVVPPDERSVLSTAEHYGLPSDGMVERFNRTLKGMLRKHAARFGMQWDTYLHRVLWAYRNTPHESTGEKPSFLLHGHDCRSPTEAALLPSSRLDVEDYRKEMSGRTVGPAN